jgi:hypothetical protein
MSATPGGVGENDREQRPSPRRRAPNLTGGLKHNPPADGRIKSQRESESCG